MENSRIPVIVGAARTPIGRYLGALSSLSAPQLGGIAIREAVRRSGVAADHVHEVIMGNVLQGGVGQAPARQAMLKAGVPGVGLGCHDQQGVRLGPQGRDARRAGHPAGDADVIVAGGMESMSNAPHYVYGMRSGVKFGDQTTRRRHDPRRALVRDVQRAHGQPRRIHRATRRTSRESSRTNSRRSRIGKRRRCAGGRQVPGRDRAGRDPRQEGTDDRRRGRRSARATPPQTSLAELKPAFGATGRNGPRRSPRATRRR